MYLKELPVSVYSSVGSFSMCYSMKFTVIHSPSFLFLPPLFSEKYMMAVIVGTIGGVAVIAFIIAAVRYVGHNNKK